MIQIDVIGTLFAAVPPDAPEGFAPAALAGALGLDSDALDQLFFAAAGQ